MLLTCKTCQNKSSNAEDFINHFKLNHRVSSLSRFCCGVDSCSISITNHDRYAKHLAEFHSDQQNECAVGESSAAEKIYRCLDCSYVCSVSSTLRSHRKRKHGRGSCDSDGAPKVALVDCDVDMHDTSGFDSSLPLVFSDKNSESVPEPQAASVSVTERRDQVHQKFNQFYLSLSSKYHIPESTIQFMIETQYVLSKESGAILTEELVDKVAKCIASDPNNISKVEEAMRSVVANNVFSEVHDPRGDLRSVYMRKKTYHSNNTYVAPKRFKVGWNEYNEKRVGHYIPVKKTLQCLFDDDSIYEQYEQSKLKTSGDDMIRDIHNGSLIQNHPILSQDRSAIGIMLYQDDLEITNSLGAARGKHKVTNVYYSLSNLEPWTRTNINVIRLAVIVAQKDTAYFGVKKSIRPLLRDLMKLEVEGFVIRGQRVKVVVIELLGDNLGTHTFTGLVENFSISNYFCRYCEESREDWRKRWLGVGDEVCSDSEGESESDEGEDEGESDCDDSDDSDGPGNACARIANVENADSDEDWDEDGEHEFPDPELPGTLPFSTAPMRTPSSYDTCLERLQNHKGLQSYKGVKRKCPLNKLSSFHWVGSCPPCIAHDLFEGIVAYDVALAIKHFISTYPSITVDYINRKIKSLKMLGSDQGDKPALVSEKMKKLRGNAVQNWNFLRFLPMILGSRVKKSDPVWQMILKLIEVTRTLTSPAVARSYLPTLKESILVYLKMRVLCFPSVPLRPKHHFFEHYAELIERFGCLMRVSTLGFESKHRFFKNAAAARKNFINITFTLAEGHQLSDSALSFEQLTCPFPICEGDVSPFHLASLNPSLKQSIVKFFGEDFLASVGVSEKVRFRGTRYSKGEAVVTQSSSTSVQLCVAELIVVSGRSCYICGELFLSKPDF